MEGSQALGNHDRPSSSSAATALLMKDIERMLIGVVGDNVVCLTLRDSKRNLYFDVKEQIPNFCFVEHWTTSHAMIFNHPNSK